MQRASSLALSRDHPRLSAMLIGESLEKQHGGNGDHGLLDLMEIKPSTRQGAPDLLRYVADLESRGEARQFDDDDSGQERRASYFVQRNVADALSYIA
jgi:hypothetical protein